MSRHVVREPRTRWALLFQGPEESRLSEDRGSRVEGDVLLLGWRRRRSVVGLRRELRDVADGRGCDIWH
jgi:hypothetical protein